MKIELSPESMSLAELTNAIAELQSQRQRLLEEAREAAEDHCYSILVHALDAIGELTAYPPTTPERCFDVMLKFQLESGITHHINLGKLKCFDVKVTHKGEQ